MTTTTAPHKYIEAPYSAAPPPQPRSKLASMSPNFAATPTFLHADKTTASSQANEDQTDSVNTVMHTPRRGRRVGKVDLGWGSPLPSPGMETVVITPRKRKSGMHGLSSGGNIQLLDSQGRALAAIPRNVIGGITSDFLHNSPNLSVEQSTQDESPSKVRKYDSLSLFEREEEMDLLSALVPVEIPLMGRMAVHRSEIAQISCLDTNGLSQSSQSERDSSSSAGGSFSTADAVSRDSQSGNDFLSPTFSLISHFPASASNSPTKHNASSVQLWSQELGQQSVQDKIQMLRDVCQKASTVSSTESTPTSWKPRLTGADMPHLDWPDSPDGPWCSAGKQLRHLQDQKRRGIARWLDEESEDEENAAAAALSFEQQHPMVAKAMHDRARKEMLIRSLSMPILHQSKHLITPSKSSRRRRSKDDASGGSRRRRVRQMQKKSRLRGPHPLSSASSTSSAVGCACGNQDESTPMVQCDACNLWYHLLCIGVAAQELGEEWFCVGCCDMAANVLSPSSLGDRASLIATPNFPRSAAIAGQQLRPSQGQLPVFTHPPTSMQSPSMRGHMGSHHAQEVHHAQHALPYGFPSALALAPSPELPSMPSSGRRSSLAGRHRASRIGWHQMEPGSPLARKSAHGYPSHRRDISGSSTVNGLVSFPAASSASPGGRRRVPTHEQHHYDALPPRTPSPRLMSTPSRNRSGNSSAARSHQYRRESSSVHDYDELFSTPSRILHGSASWGAGSAVRHAREDSGLSNNAAVVAGTSISTPWGLSTPIRGFMDGAEFSSDHSDGHGGLPSLVFSSGGMDLADLTWQLQSPSSSTRAATRARQSSVNRAYPASMSSVRERTPTAQMYSSSSNHAQMGTDGYSCPSSSPFPKTPTFSDLIHHHSVQQQQQQQHHLIHQHHRHSLHHSPTTASSKSFNRSSLQQLAAGVPASANSSVDSQHTLLPGSGGHQGIIDDALARHTGSLKAKQATSGRGRNVSSGDLMAGLGIGLDLDDGEKKAGGCLTAIARKTDDLSSFPSFASLAQSLTGHDDS